MTTITVDERLATVVFDRFDLDSYRVFLRAKTLPESQLTYDWRGDRYTLTTPARFAPILNATANRPDHNPDLPLAPHLFDYQRWAVTQALQAERFSLWLDTGLGKTPCFLEWSRHVVSRTGGRVLILTHLDVIDQVIGEAGRFYGDALPVERLATREALADWCVADGAAFGITNYAKFIPGVLPELRHLAGLVADESSMLKSGGGTTKWNLIKSARGIRFKLSSTATPAPNEVMEYASQASFLEKLRSDNDVLWTYFVHDKYGNWNVKPHATEAFYRFMAAWSIYLRDPARFGFGDILASLPPYELIEHPIDATPEQRAAAASVLHESGRGFLFADDRLGIRERGILSQLAKGFRYDPTDKRAGDGRRHDRIASHKPALVADLAIADARDGRQVIIWTVFDAEAALIAEHLERSGLTYAVLDGGVSQSARAAVLDRYRGGETRILISKASLIGYGLNFQMCRSMVFSGFDDSFERLYQAVRRAYRFGQTERVRVHVPYVPDLEGLVYTNVKRKQQQFEHDCAIQERHYRRALGLDAPKGATT